MGTPRHGRGHGPGYRGCYPRGRAGLLHSLPGNITSSQVRNHLCFSEAMNKGHLDQERQGIHSTNLQEPSTTLQRNAKSQELLKLSTDDSDLLQQCNLPAPIEQQTTNFYFACQEATGKIYTDPTGWFLVLSTKGNEYILCGYDYDSNHVLAEPMKNRKKPAKSRPSQQSSGTLRRQECDLPSTSSTMRSQQTLLNSSKPMKNNRPVGARRMPS